jgi:RNA polymerase II subunit A C-terminal domain phosphatase SSU72
MALDPRRAALQQQQESAAPVPPPPPPPVAPDAAVDGTNAEPQQDTVPDDAFKLKFCTVCASNQNRYVDAPLSSLFPY